MVIRLVWRVVLTAVVITAGTKWFAPGVVFHAPTSALGIKYAGFLALFSVAFAGLSHGIEMLFRLCRTYLEPVRHAVPPALVVSFFSGSLTLLEVFAKHFPQHLTIPSWHVGAAAASLLALAHMASFSADTIPAKAKKLLGI